MKKIIVILFLCLFLTGCISGTIAGYGVFDIDSGVRIMKSEDSTTVTITHKKGDPAPDYKNIAKLLEGVFK